MDYKFHIKTKTSIDRIDVFQIDGGKAHKIHQLQLINQNDCHIFNGTLDSDLLKNKESLFVKLYAGLGETGYIFDDLFSKPLKVLMQTAKPITNTIIVNTPQEIDCVLIDIPPKMRNIPGLKMPDTITLSHISKPQMSLQDLRNRGVDPQGKTFIAQLDMGPVDKNLSDVIKQTPLTVRCYQKTMLLPFTF